MKPNYVFENVNSNDYDSIKSWLRKKTYLYDGEKEVPHSINSFTFNIEGNKVNVIYYKSNKLMFQSTPSKEFEDLIFNLKKDLKLKIKDKIEKPSNIENEEDINKDSFIGFDESGAGECIGSIFLGCAHVKKEDIIYFKNILKGRDIKDMTPQQVLDLFNDLKDRFGYDVYVIPATYIDTHNKNIALDRGYSNLIKNHKTINSEPNNCCIVIDNYGVGYDLVCLLDSFRKSGTKIITEFKADINYICSSLASLVARRARILEIDRLSKDNILIDYETNRRIMFFSGAPNEETKIWLETYRKIYPYNDFPSFVRLKWGNVIEIEKRFPKKRLDYVFECEHKECKKPTNILLFFVDKHNSEIYCPNCKKIISKDYFLEKLPHLKITLDTSCLIHRAISKDLSNTGYLKNSKLLLTSTLYEEIDSKQPDKKKGAMSEISYIKDSKYAGVLDFEDIDTEEYRDISNDKKFMSVIKRHNSIILTKDANLATFSSLGILVLRIIQNKEEINNI